MIIPGETFPWVQALGWSLLHFVWQGLLIGLLYALVRSLVSRENSSLRYAVGLFALSVLAVCPALTVWLLHPQGSAEAGVSSLGTRVLTAEPAGTLGAVVESGTLFSDLLPALVLIWVLGVSVMIWRAVHQWRALDRIATNLAYRQADIEAMLLRVADRFGGMHGTRVLVSSFIDTPTLMGWFKPVILLPAAVVIGFPRQQLELILAHELGHLRRYDHLVNLGQAVVETLLFYHPVVHWISREIRHEREICCDNLVLSLTDSEPREYARTLAALEDVRQISPQLAVAASGGMLLDRVRRILGSAAPRSGNRHSRTIVWGLVASSAAAVSTLILMTPSAEEQRVEVFEQPRSLDSYAHELEVALIPSEQPLEFSAIQFPATANSMPAVEVQAMPVANADIDKKPEATIDTLTGTPVLAFEAPVAEQRDAEALAAPELADVESQIVPEAQVAEITNSVKPGTPVLVHKVAPDYPDYGRGGSHAKVGFEFSIDRAGRVRNIRSVSGDIQSAFAVAARNALRQWKFDPQSVAASRGRNFRQDFEFTASGAMGTEADGECVTPTGSHLCRPGRAAWLAFKAEEKVAASSQTESSASLDAGQSVACVPQTGSRVCRADSNDGGAMDVKTSAHIIVLAGGSN